MSAAADRPDFSLKLLASVVGHGGWCRHKSSWAAWGWEENKLRPLGVAVVLDEIGSSSGDIGSLNHGVLPRDCSSRGTVIMLQVVSLRLGILGSAVYEPWNRHNHIMHVTFLPPGTGDDLVVWTVTVQGSILVLWVPHAHQVVETHTGQHDAFDSMRRLPHGGEQTSKAV